MIFRKNYFLSGLVLLCVLVKAQQNQSIQTLRHGIQNGETDTSIFKAWMGLGKIYRNIYPDSAIYFHKKAKDLAEKTNEEIGKGEAIKESGMDNFTMGNYDIALSLFAEANGIADKLIQQTNDEKHKVKARKLKAGCLGNFGAIYITRGDYGKALEYYFNALKTFEEVGDIQQQAASLGNIGVIYMSQGDYSAALSYYFKALKINNETGNVQNQAANLANIGGVYMHQGNYAKALECFFNGLRINEKTGSKKDQASLHCNIGLVYSNQGEYAKALEYYFKSNRIYEQIGGKRGRSSNLGNIAIVYSYQGEHAKALKYFFLALKNDEELGNKNGIARNLGNIGLARQYQGDSALTKGNAAFALRDKYAKALEYFNRALKINEAIGSNDGRAVNLVNIGSLFIKLKKYEIAEQKLQESFEISKKIRALELLKSAHQNFSDLYEKTNRPDLALKHYQLFIQYRDSIINDENTKKSIQQEMKFNYEKMATADSVKVAEEQKVSKAKLDASVARLKEETTFRFVLYGGLALIMIFAVFMVNRFHITNRQKKLIEEQKKILENQKVLVEEKQKEVIDSIHYAKRIQTALITSEKYIERNLNKLQKR